MSWLQPTPENEQDIQQLREEQPELYAYAQVLALALRIDSRLLRNLRLRFIPKSSVELETELWFSSLIHTRNVQAATMYSGIARALCDALKDENSEHFTSTKTEIAKLTQHWPETDRIEQEMRWAVLECDEQTLKKNVQRILKTLTLSEGDFEKRELARWVKGTLPILKATTQAETEQQWLSQYVAASLGLAGSSWAEDTELQFLPAVLVNALPKTKTQKVGLRLRSGILEILNPDDELEVFEVSISLPTIVLIEFDVDFLDIESGSRLKAEIDTYETKNLIIFGYKQKIKIPQDIRSINLAFLNGSRLKIMRNNKATNIQPNEFHIEHNSNKESFSYHEHNVDFNKKSGNYILTFGGVGCGKTTLHQHIIGWLYEKSHHVIQFNPVDGYFEPVIFLQSLTKKFIDGIFPARTTMGTQLEFNISIAPENKKMPTLKLGLFELSGEECNDVMPTSYNNFHSHLPGKIYDFLSNQKISFSFLLISDASLDGGQRYIRANDDILFCGFIDYLHKNFGTRFNNAPILLIIAKWDVVESKYADANDYARKNLPQTFLKLKKMKWQSSIVKHSVGIPILDNKNILIIKDRNFDSTETITNWIYRSFTKKNIDSKYDKIWQRIWSFL